MTDGPVQVNIATALETLSRSGPLPGDGPHNQALFLAARKASRLMKTVLTPDICVIGAGSGGLSVAAAAAMFGVPVVLIERHRMGGDCLNVGCVPSKSLIAAGAAAQGVRDAGAFGVTTSAPQVHFGRVHDQVHRVIGAIAPNDSVERFTALGVQVIKGEAAFLDRRTVRVGDTEIRARRFVIATGSRPAIPQIEGLKPDECLTNETVFDLTTRPERLAVIGGGPIGVEIGQAMRRLGSDVTLIQSGRLLAKDDPETAAFAARALAAEGVSLRENTRALRVEGKPGAYTLHLSDGAHVTVTHILAAAGRLPNVEALNLSAAGIEADTKGIPVSRKLKTRNSRIYAIGDCALTPDGPMQFTHVANYHAGIVIRGALFRQGVKANHETVPRVTYSDPEVASVGLGEEEARKRDARATALRWPFAENDRAQAEQATDGLIKIVIDKKGRILGASIAGRHAGELIMPWVIAVQKGWSVKDMAGFVFPYPTLSEVSKRVAVSHFAPLAGKPWIRRIIGFLRAFG
jgi:pyruvate/2-oxoglutarate dehydrogenase complex dihydrolipoamide dehydrogenase (E3) component